MEYISSGSDVYGLGLGQLKLELAGGEAPAARVKPPTQELCQYYTETVL